MNGENLNHVFNLLIYFMYEFYTYVCIHTYMAVCVRLIIVFYL